MIDFRGVDSHKETAIKFKFDISSLRESTSTFFLAGSYYFGEDSRYSDLDLMVEDGIDVLNVNPNAYLLPNHSYLDPFTKEVWRIDGFPHIDIQVSKKGMLQHKLTISQAIKDHKLHSLNKSFQARLWRAIADIVLGGSSVSNALINHTPKHKCPKCGSPGDDLGGFAFYCTNPNCGNFKP